MFSCRNSMLGEIRLILRPYNWHWSHCGILCAPVRSLLFAYSFVFCDILYNLWEIIAIYTVGNPLGIRIQNLRRDMQMADVKNQMVAEAVANSAAAVAGAGKRASISFESIRRDSSVATSARASTVFSSQNTHLLSMIQGNGEYHMKLLIQEQCYIIFELLRAGI